MSRIIGIGPPVTYKLECQVCGFLTTCLTMTACPQCEYRAGEGNE